MAVPLISVEAMCTRWAKQANGGVGLGFVIQRDDAWAVDAITPARRYALAIVEIGDDEKPVQQVETKTAGTPAMQKEGYSQPQESVPGNTPRARNPLAQQIGRDCKDIRFQKWMSERYGIVPDEAETADKIRELCKVASRADIIEGSEAALRWHLIKSAYLAEPYVQTS